MIWAINDSELTPGIYYNSEIDALAIVSDSTWYAVGAKIYPLHGWVRIGAL